MEPKRVLTLYVLILFALVLVISLTLPGYFNFPYPQVLGPQFDPMLKRDKTGYISDNRPDMVMIGDSVLFLDVDEALLSQQLGLKAYSIALPGSGSAAWYLLLKNSILKSAHTPKYVVIFFRDTLLTVPDYRTRGRYFGLLDDYARGREPLVTQLAFVNRMDPLEKLAEQYLPSYSARWQIREVVDRKVRYSA
jgi:hypothetical protein